MAAVPLLLVLGAVDVDGQTATAVANLLSVLVHVARMGRLAKARACTTPVTAQVNRTAKEMATTETPQDRPQGLRTTRLPPDVSATVAAVLHVLQ